MHSNFAGLTEMLCRLGLQCRTTNGIPLSHHLSQTKLLVLPPPTGRYDPRRERWRCEPGTLFAREHVQDILSFLQSGGNLLAFAYRFGDSFAAQRRVITLLDRGVERIHVEMENDAMQSC